MEFNRPEAVWGRQSGDTASLAIGSLKLTNCEGAAFDGQFVDLRGRNPRKSDQLGDGLIRRFHALEESHHFFHLCPVLGITDGHRFGHQMLIPAGISRNEMGWNGIG